MALVAIQPKQHTTIESKGYGMAGTWQERFWRIEGYISCTAILWGLWLVNPYWDTFATTSLYVPMQHIAPEIVWGSIAIIAGGLVLVMLLQGHQLRLMLAMGILSFVWTFIAATFITANIASTATPMYGTPAFFSAIIVIRYLKSGTA